MTPTSHYILFPHFNSFLQSFFFRIDQKMNQLLYKILTIVNVIILTSAALIGHPSVPLSSCRRRCLRLYPGCVYSSFEISSQCEFLNACTRSCHRDYIGEHQAKDYARDVIDRWQSRREVVVENRKRELVKRACLGDCDAERYMCSQLADSIMGVFACNQSNNFCRKNC